MLVISVVMVFVCGLVVVSFGVYISRVIFKVDGIVGWINCVVGCVGELW